MRNVGAFMADPGFRVNCPTCGAPLAYAARTAIPRSTAALATARSCCLLTAAYASNRNELPLRRRVGHVERIPISRGRTDDYAVSFRPTLGRVAVSVRAVPATERIARPRNDVRTNSSPKWKISWVPSRPSRASRLATRESLIWVGRAAAGVKLRTSQG